MSTSTPKLITVIGATGAQGGSLIQALIEDGTFSVRGMTRNPNSDTAIKLKEKGVQVVYGDYDDPSSLDFVMANSYGVYVVTGAYDEKFYENKEVSRGKCLIQAAIRAGVQHFVYSGQPSCEAVTGHAYSEFEGKSKVEKFMFESGLPSTSVRQPVAMENILLDFIPLLHDEGYYVWNLPMEGKPLPMIYPPSDGKALLTIFKNPKEYISRTITIAGDCKTIEEYAAIASKHVAPYVIKASKMTANEFKKLDSPRAEDLGTMFEYFQVDYSAYDVENTKRLDKESVDFDSFMKSNAQILKKILECQMYDKTIENRAEFKGF